MGVTYKCELADPSIEGVIADIRTLNHKYRRSYDQIMLLNNRIDAMQSRFDCASAESQRTFCYNSRLRLAAFEGVRNMFYEYATRVADKLDSLRRLLVKARQIESELEDVDYDTTVETGCEDVVYDTTVQTECEDVVYDTTVQTECEGIERIDA